MFSCKDVEKEGNQSNHCFEEYNELSPENLPQDLAYQLTGIWPEEAGIQIQGIANRFVCHKRKTNYDHFHSNQVNFCLLQENHHLKEHICYFYTTAGTLMQKES